jgi:hypothetical protein
MYDYWLSLKEASWYIKHSHKEKRKRETLSQNASMKQRLHGKVQRWKCKPYAVKETIKERRFSGEFHLNQNELTIWVIVWRNKI